MLSACSFQNKYEKEADKITRAVIANNVQDVKGDFDSKVAEQMTHARVGALSDELDDQGKYEGLKEVQTADCPAGAHCFDAKFEKHDYHETLSMDDQGKVTVWRIHMAVPAAQ
ncbi:MAG: hypothetical protein JOZ38_02680 [Candidatus Eremiobacteraeota bacterium]|nr:hypothetical protein [Candidatus Eremiobacteraeota bacterium]